MAGLKNRRAKIKGRCAPDICKWFDACGGAMRVRADLVYSDPWAPEPACYLTDEEIGFTPEKQKLVRARGEDFPMPAFLGPADPPPQASTPRHHLVRAAQRLTGTAHLPSGGHQEPEGGGSGICAGRTGQAGGRAGFSIR
jgi:hypothetical protein